MSNILNIHISVHSTTTDNSLIINFVKAVHPKNNYTHFSKSGKRGIRTPDTLLTYTRFPGVPLQPLEHLSLIADAKLLFFF